MPGRRTALATELSVFGSWEYLPAADLPSPSVYVFTGHIKSLVGLIRFQDVPGTRVSTQISQLDPDDVVAFVLKLQWETVLLNSTGAYIIGPSGG